jgi:hypothetical protein
MYMAINVFGYATKFIATSSDRSIQKTQVCQDVYIYILGSTGATRKRLENKADGGYMAEIMQQLLRGYFVNINRC